jgi:hypothetical protein
MISFLASAFIMHGEELKSPDGNLMLQFEVKQGIPVYQLFFNNQSVIKESRLGF